MILNDYARAMGMLSGRHSFGRPSIRPRLSYEGGYGGGLSFNMGRMPHPAASPNPWMNRRQMYHPGGRMQGQPTQPWMSRTPSQSLGLPRRHGIQQYRKPEPTPQQYGGLLAHYIDRINPRLQARFQGAIR